MIIEVRKAGFHNKGAELMLLAIVARLRAAYPEGHPHNGTQRAERFRAFCETDGAGLLPQGLVESPGYRMGRCRGSDSGSIAPAVRAGAGSRS